MTKKMTEGPKELYQVGIIVLQYSAVWSNSAVRFGRLVNNIQPSGFYLFARSDSAVWYRPPKPHGTISNKQ